MTAPAYIYVGDQGRVFASTDEPTGEDLAYAEVGMVTIIRLADYHFYGSGRTWTSIASEKLGQASVEGELTPPFHVAAAGFDLTAPTSGETNEVSKKRFRRRSTVGITGSRPTVTREPHREF